MALTIFGEKNFSSIFMDVKGYGTIFLDSIRERNWFGLVYDNEDSDVYYCPNLVTHSIHTITHPLLITIFVLSLYTLIQGILLLISI